MLRTHQSLYVPHGACETLGNACISLGLNFRNWRIELTPVSELSVTEEGSWVSPTNFGRYWLRMWQCLSSPALDCVPSSKWLLPILLWSSLKELYWSFLPVLSLYSTQTQFSWVLSKSFDSLCNEKIPDYSCILLATLKGWNCSNFLLLWIRQRWNPLRTIFSLLNA